MLIKFCDLLKRCLMSCLLIYVHSEPGAAERPNILWISCEDISPHLGSYGDRVAITPNLDKLAAQGVRYNHAFTCHGVCAPSRTGIITAQHPISIGANHMRSKVTLPDHIRCFPEYLREAGYYCTNNSKTDYNFHWNQDEVWDETSDTAHWKNRPDDRQPFFAVFNLTMCHESRVWPQRWKEVTAELRADQFHDPASVTVPELYPDTPAVRAAIARLHDVIMVMDLRAGEILAELDAAGLADSTIVVFWSDHGDGFARAKRWVYDTGTRVPMIARIPERFRVNGQGHPGTVNDDLINLIDLGPTMLNLAGIDQPAHFQGQPFLGDNLPRSRDYIFGARDRIDERFDMVRSVRDRRFRYVRNFMTWLPTLQHIRYSEQSATRQELRRAATSAPQNFYIKKLFETPRAIHELYDLESDPYELNNLAADPRYAQDLVRLQQACDDWQFEVLDAHIIPESMLIAEERSVASRWHVFHGEGGIARWSRIFNAAMQRSAPEDTCTSDDAAERWWSLAHVSDHDEAHAARLLHGLDDESPAVRIAAARSLNQFEQHRPAVAAVLTDLLRNPELSVRHAAILAVDELDGLATQLRHDVSTMDRSNRYVETVAQHVLNGPVGQTTQE
jgi:uncharacterized sulfatase